MSEREAEPFDRSNDVLVGRLRRKIEADPRIPRLIVTVPGFRYRFTVTPSGGVGYATVEPDRPSLAV